MNIAHQNIAHKHQSRAKRDQNPPYRFPHDPPEIAFASYRSLKVELVPQRLKPDFVVIWSKEETLRNLRTGRPIFDFEQWPHQ
jgi:hypothetical protein